MLFVLFALLTVASALRITSPSSSTTFTSTGPQTIAWTAVSTDPSSFVITLSNANGLLPNSPVIISRNTNSATGDRTGQITYPGGTWPAGKGFQINFVNGTATNAPVLAQSGQFTVAGSSSSSASSSATGASNSAARTGASTTSSSAGTAAATSRAAAMDKASPSALISLLLTCAAFFGVLA